MNLVPLYFPPNCTHLVQPVDHRVAAWIKKYWDKLYQQEEDMRYHEWIEFRNNGSMSPQYQRVTALKWMNIVWKCLKNKPKFLTKAFTSTGCFITLKGKHEIKFNSTDNYQFDYPHIEDS